MLVLLCLLVLFLPGCTPAGESQLIGPPDPIVAVEGDYVILPCSLEPSIDAEFLTVEWTRPDLDPKYVHLYRNGRNLQGGKNPSYRYRTMLFEDELVRGNVSLKLFRVKLEDEGNYTCLVIKDGQKKKTVIQLKVGEVSKPEVSIMEANGTGRVLQCVSGGWYPEPELEWRDSEGRLLPADVTQTHRHPDPGPHQRYNVRSNMTVQKTGWFTCRVHLQGLNQTKETKIHVLDDFISQKNESSSEFKVGQIAGDPAVLLVVFLVLVGVGAVGGLVFAVVWLMKKRAAGSQGKDVTYKYNIKGETVQPVEIPLIPASSSTRHPEPHQEIIPLQEAT